MLRRVVTLILIAAALGIAYRQFGSPQRAVPRYLGHLESSLNQELLAAGLTDTDITLSRREEHNWAGLRWIETRRTIHLPIDLRRDTIIRRLKAFASRERLGWSRTQSSGNISVIVLSKWGIPLQTILLTSIRVTEDPLSTHPSDTIGPQAAIVIDDVGYDLATLDRYAALKIPLTFAILPGSRLSKPLSEKARALGFPVILHLPMQPIDLAHNDPGPSGLYLTMSREQLQKQFEKDVASVPGIVGLNNHMGSAFTEDAERMGWLLSWVKARGLFFLDSRTSNKSVAIPIARKLELRTLVNETFLDNIDDPAAIDQQLDKVIELALKHRRTVAIGHYRRKHLVQALEQKIPEFKRRGVTLTVLPALLPR